MASNLFTAFAAASSQRNKIFLFPPGRAPLKFSDVFEKSARFAHVLKAHGVKPGDRVAVQVEKSAEALILYLASLRMGAVFLPLNTGYTASELSYFITDAAPRVFVCSPKNRDVITDLCDGGEVLTLGDDGQSGSLVEEAKGRPTQFPDADVGMDDLAAILYTSGTTGRSKGAMLSHGNLLSNAQALKDMWAVHRSGRAAACLADFPHPRPFCGYECQPVGGIHRHSAAQIRCGRNFQHVAGGRPA